MIEIVDAIAKTTNATFFVRLYALNEKLRITALQANETKKSASRKKGRMACMRSIAPNGSATRPAGRHDCNSDAMAGEQLARVCPHARFGYSPNFTSGESFSGFPKPVESLQRMVRPRFVHEPRMPELR